MIITFLESNFVEIRICSDLLISRNSLGKSVTQSFFRTAWLGIFPVFDFKSHVLQTYIQSNDNVSVNNPCRETVYLPTLNPKTDLLYTHRLQTTHLK